MVTTKLTVLNVNNVWRLVLAATPVRVICLMNWCGMTSKLESWHVRLATACDFLFATISTTEFSDRTTAMEGAGRRVGGAEGVANRVDDPAELGVFFENPEVAVCGLKEEVLCVVCANAVGSPRLGEGVIELEDLTLSG